MIDGVDPMHILVVDDSDDSRDITSEILGTAGYENIDCKSSAAETFAFLKIGVGAPAAVPASPLSTSLFHRKCHSTARW